MSSAPEYKQFPVRKSPRLKSYDYATANYYFITICTKEKCCIFGSPGKPNQLGLIATDCLLQIPKHFPEAQVDKFIVMPNHIHAIIVLKGSAHTLSTIVGLYKSHVTKCIHAIAPDVTVWQTSFHDHVIRNQPSYEKIWSYIDSNPAKWQEDCFYMD